MKTYQTPKFCAVRIEDEDILTITSGASAKDSIVQNVNYAEIIKY